MSPKPRKNTITNIPNLFAEKNKRGEWRFRYRNTLTGEKRDVGKGQKRDAERIAREANRLIAKISLHNKVEDILFGSSAHKKSDRSWSTWCDEYLKIQEERLANNIIRQSTYKQIASRVNRIKHKFKNHSISQLSTYDFTRYIKEDFVARGKLGAAIMIRSTLIDICSEAISEGIIPHEKGNPARYTRPITRRTKRARLLIGEFKAAIDWAKENQPAYVWKALMFALLTGQRRSDVLECKFQDIFRMGQMEYIGITQKKTGTKIAIPLDLRLEAVEFSIRDVIDLCRRQGQTSKYLFYHPRKIGSVKAGEKIHPDNLTNKFNEALRTVRTDWGKLTPPTLHEIRSLSGREYHKQGIDIQKLLGHKQESTTATYKDPRGQEWITVELK